MATSARCPLKLVLRSANQDFKTAFPTNRYDSFSILSKDRNNGVVAVYSEQTQRGGVSMVGTVEVRYAMCYLKA